MTNSHKKAAPNTRTISVSDLTHLQQYLISEIEHSGWGPAANQTLEEVCNPRRREWWNWINAAISEVWDELSLESKLVALCICVKNYANLDALDE
jgi:hypothetical protein